MDKEIRAWLDSLPEGYKIVGSKIGEYHGEQQIKIFLRPVTTKVTV